jgi:hypothetical protein
MRYVSLFLTAAVMLLAAACGGDDAAPTPSPAATSRSGGLPASPIANGTVVVTPPSRDPTPTQDPGTTAPFKANGDPNPPRGISLLQTMRIGTQDGWDRIAFEFKDTRPAVEIEYVTKAQTCGKGDDVSLPGDAMLSVRFRQTQAHTDAGVPTLPSREMAGPGSTILKASVICDFEGETGVAIGVKTKTPYKVTMLQNPTRVVIDVKQ